mgnify:CR=1 FL=1
MKIRTFARLATLGCTALLTHTAQAQGFVFGTAAPEKTQAAQPAAIQAGTRTAKVEAAQRLLTRMGLLREAPSGKLTPATLEAIRAGRTLSEIKALWGTDLGEFMARRGSFLLY